MPEDKAALLSSYEGPLAMNCVGPEVLSEDRESVVVAQVKV